MPNVVVIERLINSLAETVESADISLKNARSQLNCISYALANAANLLDDLNQSYKAFGKGQKE